MKTRNDKRYSTLGRRQFMGTSVTLPDASSTYEKEKGFLLMKRKIISAARTVLFLALCGGCMGSVSRASDHETTPERMNILFFLVDDLGYKDIVANRTPETDGPTIYETPAADRLAADGMTFTQAYSNGPRCVVSRVSMMSGNYHFKPCIYPSI